MSQKILIVADLTQWLKWRDEWEDLLANSTAFEAKIFLSYEWLTTWWRFFGDGKKLMVIGATDGRKLIAAAPLFSAPSILLPSARIVRFVGSGNSDYGDFLVRKDCQEAAKLIWHWLFSNRHLWDVIALHELPSNSETISALQQTTIPSQVQADALKGEICHRVPLNSNAGSWLEKASKSLQEQLKRRERQIFRNFAVRFSLARNESEVQQVMTQLFALHRLRWGQLGQTGVFILPKVRQFHIEFAKQAFKRGWLRLHWLTLDSITAAVYYAFRCGDYSGFYTCGFNPKFARYSVGKVLLAKVINEAEREGAKIFDFMRGNETYKSDFGTVIQHNFHLFVWKTDNPISRATATLHKFVTWLVLRLKESAQR